MVSIVQLANRASLSFPINQAGAAFGYRFLFGVSLLVTFSSSPGLGMAQNSLSSVQGDKGSTELGLLQDIESSWKAQRARIVTARIRFKMFRQGMALSPLTHDRLTQLIENHDFESSNSDEVDILQRLWNSNFTGGPAWAEWEFLKSGIKLRETDFTSGDVNVFDGDCEIRFDHSNRQVELTSPGGSQYSRLSLVDFQKLPDALSSFAVISGKLHDSETVLKQPLSTESSWVEIVLDSSSNTIRRISHFESNLLAREIVYKSYKEYPGDIYFPQVVVKSTYRGGSAVTLCITVIRSAEFNIDIADDQFTIATPDGTNIFDYRRPPHVGTFVNVPATTNISDAFRHTSLTSAPDNTNPAKKSGWMYLLVLGNVVGFALVFFGVAIKRREKRT